MDKAMEQVERAAEMIESAIDSLTAARRAIDFLRRDVAAGDVETKEGTGPIAVYSLCAHASTMLASFRVSDAERILDRLARK